MRFFQLAGLFLLMWCLFLLSYGYGQTNEPPDELQIEQPTNRGPDFDLDRSPEDRHPPGPRREKRRHRDGRGFQDHDVDGPKHGGVDGRRSSHPRHRRGGIGGGFPRAHMDRHRDPEMQELIRKDMELQEATRKMAQRLRITNSQSPSEDQENNSLETLKNLVHEHFEVRQQRRLLQLERLRKELKRLEESIERRNEARELITERRIAELTGESHDLEF